MNGIPILLVLFKCIGQPCCHTSTRNMLGVKKYIGNCIELLILFSYIVIKIFVCLRHFIYIYIKIIKS
jgi:hypothetical protein